MALPRITMRNAEIIVGDVRAGLAELPDGSVHTQICSPPYWGLRAYGTEPQIWGPSGEQCQKHGHVWESEGKSSSRNRNGAKGGLHDGRETDKLADNVTLHPPHGDTCIMCGAWRGEHGLEPTIDLYVQNEVLIFREVRRVLRDDGICWVNLGDSYNSNPSWGRGKSTLEGTPQDQIPSKPPAGWLSHAKTDSLKPKDLCGIPWRVVLALQQDGWFWRDTICWAKKSPMPESVTDRCTKSWEPIFMLTKSARYYADMQAVREEGSYYAWTAPQFKGGDITRHHGNEAGGGGSPIDPTYGRNLRNVWHLGPEPYAEAHFATFPGEIPRRCILASTSERGCCPECGAPWERVTERNKLTRERPNELTKRNGADGTGNHCANTVAGVSVETTGWQPTCQHIHTETEPCTVLDIFSGSGTTVMVAVELGRKGIGLELNPEYAAMSKRRIKRGWKREKPKQTTALSGQKDLFAEIGDPA